MARIIQNFSGSTTSAALTVYTVPVGKVAKVTGVLSSEEGSSNASSFMTINYSMSFMFNQSVPYIVSQQVTLFLTAGQNVVVRQLGNAGENSIYDISVIEEDA